MKQFGLQLFTVRDALKTEEDFAESMKKIAAMGYKDLHTAGCLIDEQRFIDIIRENGMNVCGTHCKYDFIVGEIDASIALHKKWGTNIAGIGSMPSFAYEGLDGLKKFIADYNEAAKKYASEGIKLSYHNHWWEFFRIDGTKTRMDYLYEEFDPENISFVLDTCWVQVGGGDIRHWMEKLAGRIDILHLKDCMAYKGDDGKGRLTMTEVGNGNLWMEGIIETADKIGVKSYVVEQDSCPGDPFDSIKQSADYLKKLIK